jgi:hypothetical protein
MEILIADLERLAQKHRSAIQADTANFGAAVVVAETVFFSFCLDIAKNGKGDPAEIARKYLEDFLANPASTMMRIGKTN